MMQFKSHLRHEERGSVHVAVGGEVSGHVGGEVAGVHGVGPGGGAQRPRPEHLQHAGVGHGGGLLVQGGVDHDHAGARRPHLAECQ